MTDREIIHQYLKSLTKYLSRLDKTDTDEVIKEIESHIYDSIEDLEHQGINAHVTGILEGFGQPRQLAEQYVAHILDGASPPTGFKAIQSVKKGVTRSLYYSMASFGFGISLLLALIGIIKIFSPHSIGVWSAAQGNSFAIALSGGLYPNSSELLGFWLIPISLILSFLIGKITWRILKILKQKL